MNAEPVVERFYAAFARRDGDAMAACYAAAATFRDPVFTLTGSAPGAMWRMLTSRSSDLSIDYTVLTQSATSATARWTARYPFGPRRRPVVNVIDSRFRLADDHIVEQVDQFDFARWARQALGLPGLLLGHTGWLQRKVQADARRQLQRWQAAHPATPSG